MRPAAGRRQGVLGRRQLRADRRDDATTTRRRTRVHARGARPRVQRHQLLQADRVGDPRPRGRRRARRRAARRRLGRGAARPGSSTATPASASPPATTPRSAGRCCAAWPRRSTTCSPARRSPARRPSASGSCRCASTTTRCRTGRWRSPTQLAAGAQSAIRWTKQTLNNWYRAQSADPRRVAGLRVLRLRRPRRPRGPGRHTEKRGPAVRRADGGVGALTMAQAARSAGAWVTVSCPPGRA